MSRYLFATVVAFMAGVSVGTTPASDSCPVCNGGYQLVERTVQVPTMVTERRVVHVTVCRPEVRERTVNVQRLIPEMHKVRDFYTLMVPRTETRLETCRVAVPVWREVVQEMTVQVPTQELRKGTRHICRPVQVQETRSVTCDRGQWEDVVVDVGCSTYGYGYGRRQRFYGGVDAQGGVGYDAGCAPTVTHMVCRVWKPNLVTEEVPVTVWRTETIEEPYEYQVTVYHPEVKSQRVKVCDFVTEEKQREVQVTFCVPERRETIRDVTSYRTVIEPRVEQCIVQVPHIVAKEVEVQVCRMVTKKVVCRVPVCGH